MRRETTGTDRRKLSVATGDYVAGRLAGYESQAYEITLTGPWRGGVFRIKFQPFRFEFCLVDFLRFPQTYCEKHSLTLVGVALDRSSVLPVSNHLLTCEAELVFV